MFFVHFDIRFSITVFDDVYHQIIDDFRIYFADSAVLERIAGKQLAFFRVVSVLADICDNVRNAHYAPFQRGGRKPSDIAVVEITAFHFAVKFGKAVQWNGAVLV